eukprot:g607.t1
MSSARKKGSGKKGSRFFATMKKGELYELQRELGSRDINVVKEAVKKVIACMTVGTDVSMLFTDVLKRMQTADLELKKLVYLYIMNYAKSKPDLAILAVNTFKRDTQDPNALIRAMAVRTMGCIRVERITEYLTDPLRLSLKDSDPYVRKTAAVCVAKLFDISPELVVEQGFLDLLHDLVSDSNPMVVANAVAALTEIHEASDADVLKIDSGSLKKLLVALNECTEWGQVSILDALAFYTPSGPREAESIIERVVPRLNHANASVVLSAIKVVLVCLDHINDSKSEKQLVAKLSAPLVSLMSHSHGQSPEIQYVALRNISLIIQKQPKVLENNVKIFFCTYDDPIYVKMEKLEILIRLASERNIEQVLLELKEATTREVDVEFVRKATRAIGRCAIKLKRAASRCINVLLELLKTKVSYIVQEAIVIIKDIFRKYPNHYESIIGTLCESLESLNEPAAKGAMIWIIGEYAEKIDNAGESLQFFLDTFEDEEISVKLQLVTAVVKLFLKKPGKTKDMVKHVLKLATEDSDDADLRDRGFVYWRLLSTDPKAAKAIVLAERDIIEDDTALLEPSLLDGLVKHISTLSAVYQKPPEAFVSIVSQHLDMSSKDDDDDDDDDDSDDGGYDDSDDDGAGDDDNADSDNDDELILDLGGSSDATNGSDDALADIFGSTSISSNRPSDVKLHSLVKARSYSMSAAFVTSAAGVALRMKFENVADAKFAIQFNKNGFGFKQGAQNFKPDGRGMHEMPVTQVAKWKVDKFDPRGVQTAMKPMSGVEGKPQYFFIPWELRVLGTPSGQVPKSRFIGVWKGLSCDSTGMFGGLATLDTSEIRSILEKENVFFVNSKKMKNNQEGNYFSMKLIDESVLLIELRFKAGVDGCKVMVKSSKSEIGQWVCAALQRVLQK